MSTRQPLSPEMLEDLVWRTSSQVADLQLRNGWMLVGMVGALSYLIKGLVDDIERGALQTGAKAKERISAAIAQRCAIEIPQMEAAARQAKAEIGFDPDAEARRIELGILELVSLALVPPPDQEAAKTRERVGLRLIQGGKDDER